MGRPMKLASFILALALLFSLAPAYGAVFHSDVRVMLSIG